MEASKKMESQERKGPHLAIFPLPFQGHINPMMQLASLLHSKGFSITIIYTNFNSLNPSNFPNFHFELISDGLSNDEAQNEDPLTQVCILNNKCKVPFHDCLSRIQRNSPYGPITCLITDLLWHFPQAIVDQLKLPRLILQTFSVISALIMVSVKIPWEEECLHKPDCQSNDLVPKFSPLRFKDLPNYRGTDPEVVEQFKANLKIAVTASLGIIANTFDALEITILEKVRQEQHAKPLFTVGPLHKFAPGSPISLLTYDCSCMDWLDKQEPQSVIYVSFGSVASINKTDLEEIAWGLANSEQPFLWVIRPRSINGYDWVELPQGFEETTKDRGYIVKWAPQQEVLAHSSIGGFWTHNGWNSVMESISEGVPMICCPWLWDQQVQARYVSHVWKVGMQLENGLERGEIEWAIKRLMAKNEGKEMRERASGLKENAMACIRKGGSSYESLESLSHLIMSL